jgi:hypothetical protein
MWLEFCLGLALTKFAIFTVCSGHHGGSLKYSSHVKCRRQQFSELKFSCQSWRFFELPDLLHITMQSCTIWTGLFYWRMFFAGCAIWTRKKRERCVMQSEIHWAVEILKRNVCKKKNMKSHLTVLKHLVEHSSKCGAQWTLHCCGCVCVCVFLSEGLRGRRERERSRANKQEKLHIQDLQYGIKWLNLGPSRSLGPNNMRPWSLTATTTWGLGP